MAEQEDIPYEVSEHATPEEEKKQADPDQSNKSILVQVLKDIQTQIDTHNSLDAVKPEMEKTMTTQQQITVHKQVVIHLRSIKTTIDNKIKELK